MPSIAIIGLGYVGLPLSLQFARSGATVLGFDIDPAKVKALRAGQSYIKHISSEEIKAVSSSFLVPRSSLTERRRAAAEQSGGTPPLTSDTQRRTKNEERGTFSATADFSRIREVEAIIICVPTPLNKNREPDISYILETGKAIAPYLQKGTLVVLESTTYPGTTDEDLRKVLESSSFFVPRSSLKRGRTEKQPEVRRRMLAGRDFHLAFSPEREDPGNPQSQVSNIPKVVGGYTPACLQKAIELYSLTIKTIVPVSSCRAAEATKLLENIFRSVNIALVNELKVVYSAMGIDIWEVIAAAKTKPFGFMPFYPGPGLGGHCIPIDPFYLTWKAREFGKHTRFIELAGEINTSMPEYVIANLAEALNERKKPINGSKILVVGLAYKPNVDDDRESPSYTLMELLAKRGASVSYYDPHVPVIKMTREHSEWAGTKSIAWGKSVIAKFDAVLISTAHAAVNYKELAEWAKVVVDTRNIMAGIVGKAQIVKA